MEDPTKNPQENQAEFLTREEILALNPGELAEHLNKLDEEETLKDFLQEKLQDDSLLAHISYWEKWYTRDQQTVIDDLVHERFKKESGDWELPLGLEEKYSEEELKILFINLITIQLTFGCSRGCPSCGLDAVPGVREHLPFKLIKNLIEKYGKHIFHTYLYHASEPYDYYDEESGKKYPDVCELIKEFAHYTPFTATREFRDGEWVEFLKNSQNETRLSLHGIDDASDLEEIGLKKNTGKGKEMTKGLGVSRRETGIKLEEKGRYLGVSSFENGVTLTPRGLYNQISFPLSDEHPQGIAMIPIEKINDDEPVLGEDISKFVQHKIIEGKTDSDPFYDQIFEKMVEYRMKGKVNSGVYVVVAHSLSKKWLVQYDIDGKIDEIVIPDRTKIKDMAFCLSASAKYVWNQRLIKVEPDKLLSEDEMKRVKFHMFSKDVEEIKPVGEKGDIVIWQLNVPEVGRVAIFMDDAQRDKGLTYFAAFKAEKNLKMIDEKPEEKGSTSP